MTRIRLLAVASAALLASAAAAAAVTFSQADPNHDGIVTFPEAVRVYPLLKQVQFHKCDPNGDGVIDKSEFPLLNNFYWNVYLQRN